MLKYDSKIKFGKLFNSNSDFPEFKNSSDAEFQLNIKKEDKNTSSESEAAAKNLAGMQAPSIAKQCKSKYVLQSAITFDRKKSHYIAYCRDEDNKDWFRYDDNQVRQITTTFKEELVQTPYLNMLVYRKKAESKDKPSGRGVGTRMGNKTGGSDF